MGFGWQMTTFRMQIVENFELLYFLEDFNNKKVGILQAERSTPYLWMDARSLSNCLLITTCNFSFSTLEIFFLTLQLRKTDLFQHFQ